MNQRDIVLAFLRGFCTGDVESLKPLLTKEFHLSGPFFEFDSRDAYLSSLEEDPPEDSGFSVLEMLEDGDRVCVFYEFSRPRFSSVISQLFKFQGGKIAETLLVFDTKQFE